MFIRSDRLFLRPCWSEDWQDIHALIAHEDVVRNLARVPWPYTAEDARAFVAAPEDHRLPRFLVSQPGRDGERLLGVVGLSLLDDEVNLGYWIARDQWGNGYASEAARAVLSLARTLGHERVVASHFADNPASGRVLMKTGFVPTGRRPVRHSAARGTVATTVEYAIDLAPAGNSGGSGADGDDGAPMAPAGRKVA